MRRIPLPSFCFSMVCGLLTAGTCAPALADTFNATYLSAGVQTPAGITSTYETFNNPNFVGNALVSSITGTYTGSFQILSADTYGGAGGAGNFIQVPAVSSYTLTLNSTANYFGLWFSALDGGNQLQFYNNNTLLYSFTPSAYMQLVGTCPTNAPEPNYCGNPNPNFYNQDSGEQFAYLNFYDLDGSFNKVVFTETNYDGNFESDNQAVALLANGTPVVGTPIEATPEPASWSYAALGLCGIAGFALIDRRRYAAKPAYQS